MELSVPAVPIIVFDRLNRITGCLQHRPRFGLGQAPQGSHAS
jgi:hypothetical protein